MTPKQIKFFRKPNVKSIILSIAILPFICIFNCWLLLAYGQDLSFFWRLYIGVINGLGLTSFFIMILSHFYDAYLDKQEFINYCREKEKELQQETGG